MSYASKKGWQDAAHVAGPGWEGHVPAGKGFLEYRRRTPGTRRGVVVKAKGPPPGYPHDGLRYYVGLFGHPQGWGSDRVLWFEETRSRATAFDLGDRVVERGYVPMQVAAVEADAAKKKARRKNPGSVMAKKTKDPYVLVEGKAPDGSYFGANYRTSQLPALFAGLRTAGVFDITVDEREVDLREPRKNPSMLTYRLAFNKAIDAYQDSWHRGPEARKKAARRILRMLKHQPSLGEQIPWDVLGIAYREVLPPEKVPHWARLDRRSW
jgi:hypothetical protein